MPRVRALLPFWPVWLGLAGALTLGFLLKFSCAYHLWDGYQYYHWCYNDLMALYGVRHFNDHAFPFLSSNLEYPVGIGLVAGLAGFLTHSLSAFFVVNSLILAVMAGVSLWCLSQLGVRPERLLVFALAPSLILYAFLNWDLAAIAMMLLALVAFSRGRDGWAGFWLGLGAATKFFPGLLLPGWLLTGRLRGRQSGWRLIAGAIGGFLLINLPIYLINADRWWYPWKFQASRFPNFETVWFFIYHHFGTPEVTSFWWTTYPQLTSWLSVGFFGLGLGILLWLEVKHARQRPWVVSLLTLILFLVTAKIFSPQYLLWLLPFLVLVRLPRLAIVSFFVVDVLTWAAIAYFLPVANTSAAAAPLAILELMVTVRYLMLIWLGYVAYHLPQEPKEKKSVFTGSDGLAMMRT